MDFVLGDSAIHVGAPAVFEESNGAGQAAFQLDR